MYKCINYLNPMFMSNTFELKNTPYEMRSSYMLILPKFNSIKNGKKSFKYHGAHLYNTLPMNIKSTTGLKSFKNIVSTWEGPKCVCDLCNVTF